MVTVSVSVYQDAHLAENALASIREHLPHARIQVVDGKYDTFRPNSDPNSTDDIQAVADAYGAEYWPEGPFEREREKHVRRVELAPPDEWLLLMDADERLHSADFSKLADNTAYSPRIFNALVYGPHTVYWPRLTKPEWVKTINRWDAYLFSVAHERTDAVTLIHRHDLRSKDYRREKYERFGRENRRPRYEDRYDTYLNDDWDADFHPCPECGRESVTRSQVTNFGESYSYVECCIAADGCHAAVCEVEVGEWRYLPDDWQAGWDDDPKRLRLELLDAGCTFVRTASVGRMVREMEPAIRLWVEHHYGEGESEVFA